MGLEKRSWVMALGLFLAGCVSSTCFCTLPGLGSNQGFDRAGPGWNLIILSMLLALEAYQPGA